jgi:hypothetical protein
VGSTGVTGTPSRYAERPLDWVEEGPLHPCLVTDVGAFVVIPPKRAWRIAPPLQCPRTVAGVRERETTPPKRGRRSQGRLIPYDSAGATGGKVAPAWIAGRNHKWTI